MTVGSGSRDSCFKLKGCHSVHCLWKNWTQTIQSKCDFLLLCKRLKQSVSRPAPLTFASVATMTKIWNWQAEKTTGDNHWQCIMKNWKRIHANSIWMQSYPKNDSCVGTEWHILQCWMLLWPKKQQSWAELSTTCCGIVWFIRQFHIQKLNHDAFSFWPVPQICRVIETPVPFVMMPTINCSIKSFSFGTLQQEHMMNLSTSLEKRVPHHLETVNWILTHDPGMLWASLIVVGCLIAAMQFAHETENIVELVTTICFSCFVSSAQMSPDLLCSSSSPCWLGDQTADLLKAWPRSWKFNQSCFCWLVSNQHHNVTSAFCHWSTKKFVSCCIDMFESLCCPCFSLKQDWSIASQNSGSNEWCPARTSPQNCLQVTSSFITILMSTSFFLVPGAERSQHDSFSDQTSWSSSVLLQKQQHCNTFFVHAATVRVGGQQLLQEFHSSTLLQTCFTPTLTKMQHHPTATSLTGSTNYHSACRCQCPFAIVHDGYLWVWWHGTCQNKN